MSESPILEGISVTLTFLSCISYSPLMSTEVSAAQMAVAEMRGLADTFSRLTEACYKKCIPNVKEGQLNVGEMSCTDRCVSKYLDVHTLVGTELNNITQQAQQTQQTQQ